MLRSMRALLEPVGLILLLLAAGGRCEDTVAASVGLHTMSRIAELLSPSECRQLQQHLVGPDEDLKNLSEENNPIRPHHQRHIRSPMGCSDALRYWLRTAGESVTWDRLTRTLRRIGRLDIARELGKNLNQDRRLELQRNVLGYGRSVRHPSSSLLLEGEQLSRARGRRGLDGDLGELRFGRRPPPPYTRSLLGWVGPVLSGILGGFLASALFFVAAMYSCRRVVAMDTT